MLGSGELRSFRRYVMAPQSTTYYKREAIGCGNLGVIDVFLLISIESHDIADDTKRTRNHLIRAVIQQLDDVGEDAGAD